MGVVDIEAALADGGGRAAAPPPARGQQQRGLGAAPALQHRVRFCFAGA
jgi:hypothetical protein